MLNARRVLQQRRRRVMLAKRRAVGAPVTFSTWTAGTFAHAGTFTYPILGNVLVGVVPSSPLAVGAGQTYHVTTITAVRASR